MTPEELVAAHPITAALKKLGVTQPQLDGMRFWRRRNGDWPFSLWPCTWIDGTPAEAEPLIRSYCALKWLMLENPPPGRDRDEAHAFVAYTEAAPFVAIGRRMRDAQQRRATKPRGKVSEDGRTMGQVIADFVRRPEYREALTKELWEPFFAELEALRLDPERQPEAAGALTRAYVYNFDDRRKSISYSQFANVVSKSRGDKKSG